MALENGWIRFVANVVVGTIAGGMSDTVAVWMLFHPRRKVLGFQGAIPKNQARLAKSLGRTVGERLLTPNDILAELTRAGFPQMLDATLASVIENLLETERGSIREVVPPAVLAEIEGSLFGAVPMVVGRLADFVDSEEFEARTRAFVARTRAEIAHLPVGDVLSAERRAGLRSRAAQWAEDFAQSAELEQGVRDYLSRNAQALLSSPAPLVSAVPAPVSTAVRSAVESYLPLAVEKLGDFLKNPAARERIRVALRSVFERFVDDLRFHERVIARIVVTERAFEKALDSLERDGVEQLASLLDDDLVRHEVAHAIQDAVSSYLRKPLAEIVGSADGDRARALVSVTGDYVLRILRAEQTRALLVERLDAVLEKAEDRTWGELLAPLGDATITEWIVRAARSSRAGELLEDAARGAVSRALDRPIGRPGRWLPPDTAPRIARVLSPAIWTLIEAQLPGLIQRLDVQAMVERKVMAFSTERLEELIKGVIERELRLIIFCGYILGGLIAVVGFALSRLVGL